MVYILFNRDKIFGVYGTLKMLQSNCYIFVYQLYNTRKLDRDTYIKIKNQLDELALDSLESLQKTMAVAYIDIESHDLENDSFKALENISKHIDGSYSYAGRRFDNLEKAEDARAFLLSLYGK